MTKRQGMDWRKLHDTSTDQERMETIFDMLQMVECRQERSLTIRGLALRRRAHAHWLGYTQSRRPRRHERALLFTIIVGGVFVLELDQYLLWLSFWSGGAAVFINWRAAHKLIPRRQKIHWIRGG